MNEVVATVPSATGSDDARLESLGYRPQLSRVLGFFSNFAVAFTYLSPMVGIYSLFVLGVGTGGPAYVWLTWVPVIGMLFVALVFGELASHYPVAGALYQYSKFSVGPKYGWFVGWFYGIALLITVAAVDTGVVSYVTALTNNWFGWNLDPTDHLTILVITVILLAIQTTLNITGAKVMGRVAQFGVYVEILGTVGIAVILGIHGFHHGLDFLFTTQNVQSASSNPLGLDFGGQWLTGAALIAVLAPVYIFYGFESAGDISEETKDAGRQVPRSMRHALIWGGVSSFILIAALLLAMPTSDPVGQTVKGGGVPFILGQLGSGLQDFLLILIIFAFFSCGTSVQGAGSRLAFSYARDGALPGSAWVARVNSRFKTPTNALLAGAAVTVLFVLLVFYSPDHDIKLGFITYPANINALVSLVSFGVSGIYLSFLLTAIASVLARARGWVPEGRFRLGRWGWTVSVIAVVYLGLMLLNVVAPTGLASPRGYFNLDWITLLVMAVVALVGAIYFVIARPDRGVGRHLHDELEPTAAERVS
ncbi:amino acid permease-associated protein [Micromonospora globispora]|uniref:Amino acid permease-associated protein n=1 Tax=Micromonospora globispora TaxID=1450148 RepID=A0A317K8H1_9ACTN|nr:amino acid permease [Micromonospora globispora]PWU49043.1 amino acid permease-associated protein [Micromonospora globispora]PWU61949.1 amino acid permease-associated protein [Micromonospora globispora]RQW99050.1 amino acid permease-associated protein [Micromonospora globispora]